MVLIAGGALVTPTMSGNSASAEQSSAPAVSGRMSTLSAPAFLTLKQQTLPDEWTAAPQPPPSPAAGGVTPLTPSPDDPAAVLPVPRAGAVLQLIDRIAEPGLVGGRRYWPVAFQGLSGTAGAEELGVPQARWPGPDDQGMPGVALELQHPSVVHPRITAVPPAPAATVRDGRPVVYESGDPSTVLKPSFRLLCDACQGVNYAINYLTHRTGTLSQYSVTEAVIVNVLQMGSMAVTGGGQIHLVELNF